MSVWWVIMHSNFAKGHWILWAEEGDLGGMCTKQVKTVKIPITILPGIITTLTDHWHIVYSDPFYYRHKAWNFWGGTQRILNFSTASGWKTKSSSVEFELLTCIPHHLAASLSKRAERMRAKFTVLALDLVTWSAESNAFGHRCRRCLQICLFN